MLQVLFTFLFIYLVLFIVNTDDIDKKMMYHLAMNGDYARMYHHPVKWDVGIGNYLVAPFYFDRNRIMKISNGNFINAYCFKKRYARTQQLLQNKMFWNSYLPHNDIKVPKLYATTSPYNIYADIDPEKEYISKPEYGTIGNCIKIVKGKDVKPTKNNQLIQEKIGSCGYDGARSYRVITTYDGEVFAVYEFKNDNKIVSNKSQGGTAKVVKRNPEIKDMVEKLRRLHARDFDFCFTIGWDLMVDCDDVYVLEGNWPSGLFINANKNESCIERIKTKARKFYALNNL